MIIITAIKEQLKSQNISQRKLCCDINIEYSAFNTFINAKKGIRYDRLQRILDYLNITAVGPSSLPGPSLQKSVWNEIRLNGSNIAELSRKAGKSYAAIWNFVNGKGGMSIEDMEAILSLLGISLKYGNKEDRQN